MNVLELLLMVVVSMLTSHITTKRMAIRYLDVVDGYAKFVMDGIKKSVDETKGIKQERQEKECI